MTGPVEGGGAQPTRVDFTITPSPSETDETAAPASPASISLPKASESTSSSGAVLRGREGAQPPDKEASLPRTGDPIGEAASLTLSVMRSEGPSLPEGCEDVTDPDEEYISIKVTRPGTGPDGDTVTVSVEKNPEGDDPEETRSDLFKEGLKGAFKKEAEPEEQYLEELGILNDLLDKMHQKIMEYMTPRYPIS